MTIRVLVADDHEVVRRGLAALLQGSEVEIVGDVAGGKAAVAAAADLKPDVVLLDIRMPDTDGLAALKEIRQAAPESRVVMLSTYDNPTYIARSVALGASDYVLKGAPRHDLIAAIERAAAGESPPADSVISRVKGTMTREEPGPSAEFPLTGRETQVLRHIALGLSNREIGESLGISVETVKEHVQNILRKISAVDRTQAAVWAVKEGLV
jgi:DNA-binding NarL/FixJ family response regulator